MMVGYIDFPAVEPKFQTFHSSIFSTQTATRPVWILVQRTQYEAAVQKLTHETFET